MDPRQLAYAYLDSLPDFAQVPLEEVTGGDHGGYAINTFFLDRITEDIQEMIAEICATLIDAGSERDVVMEDDELNIVLGRVFKDWSDHP
jgi:hypothetical protein